MQRTMALRKLWGAYRLPGGIDLRIVHGDIAQCKAACVVNAGNASLESGGRISGAIHAAAGPALLQSCLRLPVDSSGIRCHPGSAKLTRGPFHEALPAQHVVHAVGPDLSTLTASAAVPLLKHAVTCALELANEAGCESVALPPLSCGLFNHGEKTWTALAPGVILRACADFAAGREADTVHSLVLILLVSLDTGHCTTWCTAAADIGLTPALHSSLLESGAHVRTPQDSMGSVCAASAAISDAARSSVAATTAASSSPSALREAYSGLRDGPAFNLPAASRGDGGPLCSFLAIGDWGDLDPRLPRRLAANMAAWSGAQSGPPPDFILALGDNFYSSGVGSVDDPSFKLRWADVFTNPYPRLHVPWCVILGNHDCMWNPQAQVRCSAVHNGWEVLHFFHRRVPSCR
jgi:O-acetyl-ADP-ribose deacetylase